MHGDPNGDVQIRVDDDGTLRIGWGEPDWFGPGRFISPSGLARDQEVSAEVHRDPDHGHHVFRLTASGPLEGIGTGAFDQPSVGWPVFHPGERVAGAAPEGLRALAYLGCEFALPSRVGAELDGWFTLPGRPPIGWPVLVRAGDGRTMMLAPLESFHEQIIGLGDGTLRCGWHGDLEEVPAGFTTELALITGDGPRACLEAWGQILRDRAGTVRPGRWADALATRPSYWTDNGAAYWYRTEPGHTPADSILAAVTDLRELGVPIGSVQLDSWFYPHAITRPFDTEDWEVPPTPMLAWEERADVLPDGIPALRRALGDPPLVAHLRHLAADAPITTEVPVALDPDGVHAMPTTPAAYERWLDQCVTWGVETLEHDWMVEVFHRSRWLRSRPGRARAWQEGIDAAARERGITLQWCMGTPADLARTVTLTQVTSVRTSGDHGYIATPGQLWAWFCITNALARALRLAPFKDVFRADPEVAGDTGEPEALLAALSTGPFGLGDRVGRFDPALATAACRGDGVLIKPQVPIAATDASLLAASTGISDPDTTGRSAMVAECWSDHPVGRWSYVMAMHCHPGEEPVRARVALGELGESAPRGPVIVWDRRRDELRRVEPDASWELELSREDWAWWMLAPVLPGEFAVLGDLDRFVPAGDARIQVHPLPPGDTEDPGGVRVTVLGGGEHVTLTVWAAAVPQVDGDAVREQRVDASSGRVEIVVEVPPRGWTTILIHPAVAHSHR